MTRLQAHLLIHLGPPLRYTPDRLVFNTLSDCEVGVPTLVSSLNQAGHRHIQPSMAQEATLAKPPDKHHSPSVPMSTTPTIASIRPTAASGGLSAKRLLSRPFRRPSSTSVITHVWDFCNGLLAHATSGKGNEWSGSVGMASRSKSFPVTISAQSD